MWVKIRLNESGWQAKHPSHRKIDVTHTISFHYSSLQLSCAAIFPWFAGKKALNIPDKNFLEPVEIPNIIVHLFDMAPVFNNATCICHQIRLMIVVSWVWCLSLFVNASSLPTHFLMGVFVDYGLFSRSSNPWPTNINTFPHVWRRYTRATCSLRIHVRSSPSRFISDEDCDIRFDP